MAAATALPTGIVHGMVCNITNTMTAAESGYIDDAFKRHVRGVCAQPNRASRASLVDGDIGAISAPGGLGPGRRQWVTMLPWVRGVK